MYTRFKFTIHHIFKHIGWVRLVITVLNAEKLMSGWHSIKIPFAHLIAKGFHTWWSRIFRPCILVPHFQVSHFPPLHFWPSRIFRSRIFSRPPWSKVIVIAKIYIGDQPVIFISFVKSKEQKARKPLKYCAYTRGDRCADRRVACTLEVVHFGVQRSKVKITWSTNAFFTLMSRS